MRDPDGTISMALITVNPMRWAGPSIPLLALLAALLLAPPAKAAFIAPTTFADDATNNGNCTLREAIVAANTDQRRDACPAGAGNDGVLLRPGTYRLTAGELTVDSANPSSLLTIVGAFGDGTVIESNGSGRVIKARSRLIVDSLEITGGSTPEAGGGLLLDPRSPAASLTLRQVTVADNSAATRGGGIHAAGPLLLERSTVSDNRTTAAGAESGGGGVSTAAQATITRSTIARNTSAATGGGIRYEAGLALRGSLLAENTASGSGDDCWTSGPEAASGGFNLIASSAATGCRLAIASSDRTGQEPGLAALADNGGPTRTHALPAGSPAIDVGPAGAAAGCGGTKDQRGAPRSDVTSAGARCDAGAYERSTCVGRQANLIGTDGNEALVARANPTVALALAGDDVLVGGPGDDALCGGPGIDVLAGGPGADVMVGGPGVDFVTYAGASGPISVTLDNAANDGAPGEKDNVLTESILGSRFSDSLTGNAERNGVVGGDGNDTIRGGGEADSLLGGIGNDTIDGGPGNDIVDGGIGNDSLLGGAGDDLIDGAAGDDGIEGGAGADRLRGGRGNDRIEGGDGNDLLVGGPGNDLIIGGPGKDRIRCGPGRDTVIADKKDRISRDCEKVKRR